MELMKDTIIQPKKQKTQLKGVSTFCEILFQKKKNTFWEILKSCSKTVC
jgi:hypothetical protein